MKLGDKVEVRNMDTDAADAKSWACGRVLRVNPDGTAQVQVDHDGHKLHQKVLTADAEHMREIEKE